jgi:hypothetical protein
VPLVGEVVFDTAAASFASHIVAIYFILRHAPTTSTQTTTMAKTITIFMVSGNQLTAWENRNSRERRRCPHFDRRATVKTIQADYDNVTQLLALLRSPPIA